MEASIEEYVFIALPGPPAIWQGNVIAPFVTEFERLSSFEGNKLALFFFDEVSIDLNLYLRQVQTNPKLIVHDHPK